MMSGLGAGILLCRSRGRVVAGKQRLALDRFPRPMGATVAPECSPTQVARWGIRAF